MPLSVAAAHRTMTAATESTLIAVYLRPFKARLARLEVCLHRPGVDRLPHVRQGGDELLLVHELRLLLQALRIAVRRRERAAISGAHHFRQAGVVIRS